MWLTPSLSVSLEHEIYYCRLGFCPPLSNYYLHEPPLRKIWLPHERALMGITVVPTSSSVFGEADFLACSEFKDVCITF